MTAQIMTRGRQNSLGFWQWASILGSVVATVAITEGLHAGGKWENGAVYTVMVFATAVVVLRDRWYSGMFWLKAATLLLLHIAFWIFILQSLPTDSAGPHGMLMTPILLADFILVLAILNRKTS
jgi:hypothetical protein